jgi:hypothetical protein
MIPLESESTRGHLNKIKVKFLPHKKKTLRFHYREESVYTVREIIAVYFEKRTKHITNIPLTMCEVSEYAVL